MKEMINRMRVYEMEIARAPSTNPNGVTWAEVTAAGMPNKGHTGLMIPRIM